jgi:hypothetical protein
MLVASSAESRSEDGGVFSTADWDRVVGLYNDPNIGDVKYTKTQLESRINSLRKTFATIQRCLRIRATFRWDYNSNMVVANEQDWINYISVHPEAAEIEGCSFPYYLMLSEILEGTMCLLIVRFVGISLSFPRN